MRTIAIIGGGFSGTMLAAHLLRAPAAPPLRIALIERTGRFGGGVAYGAASPLHLLNVPAGRMSAFHDDSEHFLRWLRTKTPDAQGGAFVPRPLYAEYLESILSDAARSTAPGATLDRISAAAHDITPAASSLHIAISNGNALTADVVVLATGNFPPANPALADSSFLRDPRYIKDPWSPGALESLSGQEPKLLIGTGLTMIDVALEISSGPGRAPIHAISRRGLLPQAHRPPRSSYHPPTPTDINTWPRTALGILRRVRAEVARGNARATDWRETLTALRAVTPDLWRSLPEAEQRRWLTHLRPFWETHRHRAAPEAWARIEDLTRSRRLRVQAARLIAIEPRENALHVRLQPRGQSAETSLDIARVINCSGPETALARTGDPLLTALHKRALIASDPLFLGLQATPDGAAIDASGRASKNLYVLGPLRRAQLWETTAVPELRIQARDLAAHVLRAIGSG
jgi:uncharacterized NAD(P)/FAD-binding protein YdhS